VLIISGFYDSCDIINLTSFAIFFIFPCSVNHMSHTRILKTLEAKYETIEIIEVKMNNGL